MSTFHQQLSTALSSKPVRYSLVEPADFHKQLEAEPYEDLHSLAYADHLQEQGHASLPEIIRKGLEQEQGGFQLGRSDWEGATRALRSGQAALQVLDGHFGLPHVRLRVMQRSADDPNTALFWHYVTSRDNAKRLVKQAKQEGVAMSEGTKPYLS